VVTYGSVPAGSITGNNLTSTDLTVTGGTGATLTAVTLDIAADAVTNAKMADNAIGNAEMTDNAVNTNELVDNAVTYSKIQNVSATDKVLGRISAGAGIIEEISTTGSGNVVRATSPTLVSPTLGNATVTTINKVIITAPATRLLPVLEVFQQQEQLTENLWQLISHYCWHQQILQIRELQQQSSMEMPEVRRLSAL
jgi:hypothetical protein